MVEDVFDTAERVSAQVPAHEIDELLLLSSWFRRFPAELARSQAARDFIVAPPALAASPAGDAGPSVAAASPAA
jgi:hypothetical protein